MANFRGVDVGCSFNFERLHQIDLPYPRNRSLIYQRLWSKVIVIFLNFFLELNFQITRERLNRDVAFLAGQITMLEQAAMREEEKIEDLKLKCEMFR